MDDIVSQIQNILSTPEGQEQLKNIQSMLGMNDAPAQQSQANAGPAQAGGQGGFDVSNLASILNSMGGSGGASAPAAPAQAAPNGGIDLSGLASMLGGMGGNPQAAGQPDAVPAGAAPAGGSIDLSGLASMFGMGGGGNGEAAGAGMPSIDMNTILKLQQVFRSMNVNDKNTQLLQALKPHFGDKRQAKVDQAISLMRLFSMLPALKESGIFAGL